MVALKPWILPTGNAFIKNPSARHARPGGDPRDDVPYAQRTSTTVTAVAGR